MAESTLANVLTSARFWERHPPETMNERQRKMIRQLIEGELTSSKWAKMTKCSQDTAHRGYSWSLVIRCYKLNALALCLEAHHLELTQGMI